MRITACVVVKDRRELMARCLDGLLAQEGVDFEVVVVDNGSTDGTYDLCVERSSTAPVPMKVLQDLGSLGRIRNVAVAAASAPYVAFVDSDCVPAPGWLAALVVALDASPSVGVVQGRTSPDPTLPRRRWDATQEIDSFSRCYECCNIAYRAEALRDGGGFDESLGFFGEDSAAGWGARRAGWGERFCDEALVHHTVTYPGLVWHLRRGLRYGNWNALTRRYPELRDEVLWHRWFLRPRSATTTLALLGAVLGLVRRPLLLLALPFLWQHRPRSASRGEIVDAAGRAAFDVAVTAGLVRGSVKERTVVL